MATYNSHSYTIAPGDTDQFDVTFPYINKNHVRVYVDGAPVLFRWTSDSKVKLPFTPSAGSKVHIFRETPADSKLVVFQNGAVLSEQDLNLATVQNYYLSQEIIDRYERLVNDGLAMFDPDNIHNGDPDSIIAAVIEEILNSQLLADLQARIGDIDLNAESILEQTSRLDGFKATVDNYADNFADIDAQIINEQSARVAGDTALADTLNLIGATSGDGLSFILDLDSVKVSGSEALGTRLSGIDTRLGDNEAAILTEQTARVNADDALANSITQLNATVDNNTADILTEQTARANADSALASDLSLLGVKSGDGSSWILDTNTVEVGGGVSLGSRLAGIESKADTNTATITTEQNTRASADSALASDISTLQSTVNGNTASIQTIQTVQDGLKAQYMVKTDVNGYVAGFGLYNTGASSDFIVLADRFAVVTPGDNPVVPFSVDASGVYMPQAFIRDLNVEKINGGTVGSSWYLGSNGKIVLDTGTHMRVIGLGFGANNDLIDWFGPKMAISSCTTSNSSFHLTTSGDSYFGGSLRAGVLSNAVTGTDLTAVAYVILGPYGSNGGPISINWSYTCRAFRQEYGATTCPTPGNPTATVRLLRSTNGGSTWTLVQTQNVTGSFWCEDGDGAGEPRISEETMTGSWTYTDNLNSTSNRMYKMELTSRNIWHSLTYVTSQKMTINSVED